MRITHRHVSFALAATAILVSSSNLNAANSPADMSPSQIVGKTYRLERMYLVSVHVPSGSVNKVLQSLAAAVGLESGKYDQVAFIDAEGLEQFRPLAGSKSGAVESAETDPSKVVTVSLIHDATVLHKALDAIYQVHPYEEPVIYVTEGWRSRSTSADESNPNRWWNQKPK
jgi:hypothetical protein